MLGIKQFYNYILKTEKGGVQPPPPPPDVVDLLNTTDATIRNGYDVPKSSNNGSSGGCSSSSSSSKSDGLAPVNRTTLSQDQSSQSHAAVRTQSLGKANNASTTNLNSSVEVLELDNSATDIIIVPAPAVPAPPPAPVVPAIDPVEAEKKIMKVLVGKLLRQYECSICYETLACAVSLHPCGCCFCYDCIADWATENKKTGSASGEASVECPLCMASFVLSNALSNRMVDSAIREVLQNLPEDLAAWEERMTTATERRRTLEASTTAKSSSSNLAAAAAPAVPAPAPAQFVFPHAAYADPFASHHRARATQGLAAMGGPRREVVELLDSQPEPWDRFGSHLARAAPAPPARPTGIQAFFGVQSNLGSTASARGPGGAGAGAGASLSVNPRTAPPGPSNAPPQVLSVRSPAGRKRGRGALHHHMNEEDDDDQAFKQAIDSMQSGSSFRLSPISAANIIGGGTEGSSSSSGPRRRSAGGTSAGAAGGAVFDLTTTTSPPNGRRAGAHAHALAHAVAAPSVPFPRLEEFYCVMSLVELVQRGRTTCSRCHRNFQKSALGTYSVYRNNPTDPLRPGTKHQWLTMCTSWHCGLCVADINNIRRAQSPRGIDWRTSKMPRNLWPIAYADLEMREQLELSEARTWQALLNG